MNINAVIENTKQATVKSFRNYANFIGRTNRPDFWYWTLFVVVVNVSLDVLTMAVPFIAVLSLLFNLAMLLPCIAIGTRRLHDINYSGWWQLLALIPLIGILILFYFWAQPAVEDGNRFGTHVN